MLEKSFIESSIHGEALNGDIDAVTKYIENGGNLEDRHRYSGGSIIEYAASRKGNSKIIQLLIKAGANANAKSFDGSTPLHYAAKLHDIESIKALFSASADPNLFASNYDRGPSDDLDYPFECTPLHWGLVSDENLSNRVGAVQLLLENGSDPNSYSADCRLPLDYASKNGSVSLAPALLKSGADASRSFALYYAIQNDNLEIARMLISAGASITQAVRERSKFPIISDLLNEQLLTPGGRKVTPLSLAKSQAMREILKTAGAK